MLNSLVTPEHTRDIFTCFFSQPPSLTKGVAEREPMTRHREGVLPKSEIFFGLLYYPMSDASKPCLKLYLSPSPC